MNPDAQLPAATFSLRRRVIGWLGIPLLLIAALNAAMSYYGALDAVNRAYDRSLTASLKSIAEGIHSMAGDVLVDIPFAAFDTFESDVQERVFHAVIGPDGRPLTGYDDLAPPPGKLEIGQVRIADARYHGEAIRLGALAKRLYDPSLRGGDVVVILFAETTESRQRLTYDLFLATLRRQILLFVVGAAALLLALRSALRPLRELSDAVLRRDEQDLTPVPDDNVPSEVRPVIAAINRHMERLSAMLAARRRFLTDAAHQLRTPLAVLTTQAEYGQRQDAPGEMRRSFAGILQTVRGARRMVNQMLTLSHAEPANGLIQEQQPVDLVKLVRDVALELAPLALAQKQVLSFEDGAEQPVILSGNPALLREMVANLVDNAIRYTPAGGQIVVALERAPGEVVFQVRDSGPGIPDAERSKVFQRFYRILGQRDTEGSGLGLAIAREISLAHGARIALGDAPEGGLAVSVAFPLAG